MSKCHCKVCNCVVEGLHEYTDWVCPLCNAGNHINDNNVYAERNSTRRGSSPNLN